MSSYPEQTGLKRGLLGQLRPPAWRGRKLLVEEEAVTGAVHGRPLFCGDFRVGSSQRGLHMFQVAA